MHRCTHVDGSVPSSDIRAKVGWSLVCLALGSCWPLHPFKNNKNKKHVICPKCVKLLCSSRQNMKQNWAQQKCMKRKSTSDQCRNSDTLSKQRVRCCWKLSDVENVSWHLLFRRRPQVLSAPFLIVRQLKVTGEVILNQASVCCHSKLLTDQLRGLSVLLQPCKLSCEQLKEVLSAALFDRHWEMVFPTESSAWL